MHTAFISLFLMFLAFVVTVYSIKFAISFYNFLSGTGRRALGRSWDFVVSSARKLIDFFYDPEKRARNKMKREIRVVLGRIDDSPRWDCVRQTLEQLLEEDHSSERCARIIQGVNVDIVKILLFTNKADGVIAQARTQGVTELIERVTELVDEVYPKLVSDHRRLTGARQTMNRSMGSPDDLDTPFDAERYAELQADYELIGTQLGRVEASMLVCDHFLAELEADLAAIAVADIVPFDVAGRLAAITEQTREIKENARTTAAEVAETTADTARRGMHLVAAKQRTGA